MHSFTLFILIFVNYFTFLWIGSVGRYLVVFVFFCVFFLLPLTIVDRATMNIWYSFLLWLSGMGLLDNSVFIFSFKNTVKKSYKTTSPVSTCTSSLWVWVPQQLDSIFCIFHFCQSIRCVLVSHFSFNLYFLVSHCIL